MHCEINDVYLINEKYCYLDIWIDNQMQDQVKVLLKEVIEKKLFRGCTFKAQYSRFNEIQYFFTPNSLLNNNECKRS